MRKRRFIATDRCYHLTSRLAHRAFFLTDEERDRAVELLRRVEEFCGVKVLAYAFMSNHFHIFIYVPEREDICEGEILRRITILYRDASLNVILAKWNRLKKEEAEEAVSGLARKGYVSGFSEYKSSFLLRMWNSSEFMRTFKQHLTMSYNGRHDHHGTMWEGRYAERNHGVEVRAMRKTAAYIDANPVNAGLADWPDCYAWCSFSAACSGDEKARQGYAFIYGDSGGWDAIREKHEEAILEALSEIAAERTEKGVKSAGNTSLSKRDPGLNEPGRHPFVLERGNPDVAARILELLKSGPLPPSKLRAAIGIKNRLHFIRYYVGPLLEQGFVRRTIPDRPNSSRQTYELA